MYDSETIITIDSQEVVLVNVDADDALLNRTLKLPAPDVAAEFPSAAGRVDRVAGFGPSGGVTVSPWTMTQVSQIIAAVLNPAFTQLASLVLWIHSGVGAVTRSVLARLMDTVHITDFGATGNGTTDDAPAIRACILAHAGNRIYVPKPAVAYLLGSSLGSLPPGTRLIFASKWTTAFKRGFSGGNLISMQDGSSLEQAWFDGNSEGAFTGDLVEIPVGHGNQTGDNLRLNNALGGTPLLFRCTGASGAQVSGSGSGWSNIEARRKDGEPTHPNYAVTNYAVKHEDPGVATGGHPIEFTNLQTGGTPSIDLGACNNFTITNSILFDIGSSVRTVGAKILGSRIAGTTGYNLSGSGQVAGCAFGSLVTTQPGSAWQIAAEFNAGFVDNSGEFGACSFHSYSLGTWTPVIKAGTTTVVVGDGTLYARQIRLGPVILFQVNLTTGSTTTGLTAGLISITPPQTVTRMSTQTFFSGRVFNGTLYRKIGAVLSGSTLSLDYDGGLLQHNGPMSLSPVGTSIFIGGIYFP
jgi:hypothetical protein